MSNKSSHIWEGNKCVNCGITYRIKDVPVFGGRTITVISYYKDNRRFNYTPKCGELKKQINSKPIARKPIKQKPRKVTGEREINLEIWNERPHVCFITNEPLGNHPDPSFFMHVLSKGAYPGFRLYKKNIVLATKDVHNQYDSGTIKNDERFSSLLKLKEELKEEYYKKASKLFTTLK